MEQMKKAREKKYDAVKGLAIFFVMLIHITADYAFADINSGTYRWLNVINKMLNAAVPVFAALTVFLCLRSGKKRGLSYIPKKLLPLLGMYLVWSFIYLGYSVKFLGASSPSLRELILEKLLQGKSFYHLYYIIMLMQLYVIIVFLSRLPVKKLRPHVWFPLAGAAAQMVILLLFVKFVVLKFWFFNGAVLAISYLTPISYGLMLAADEKKTEDIFGRYIILYAVVFVLASLARAWIYTHGAELFGGDVIKRSILEAAVREIFIFGAVPVTFVLADKVKNLYIPELLGRHSLGIYFFHPLVISLIDVRLGFNSGSDSLILAGICIKIIALFLLSLGFSGVCEAVKHLLGKASAYAKKRNYLN